MGDNNQYFKLPPGFRFDPTDEELLLHFLQRKAALLPFHPDVIPDLHLFPYDPWELNGKALGEGNQWYFYSRRTQNRVTTNGFWKALGIEEPVSSSSSSSSNCSNKVIGFKKYLSFYVGDEENANAGGIKTNWIMQEYRLDVASTTGSSSSSSSSSSKRRGRTKNNDYNGYVVCRVYERDGDEEKEDDKGDDGTELSCLDEVFLSLDDLDDISFPLN